MTRVLTFTYYSDPSDYPDGAGAWWDAVLAEVEAHCAPDAAWVRAILEAVRDASGFLLLTDRDGADFFEHVRRCPSFGIGVEAWPFPRPQPCPLLDMRDAQDYAEAMGWTRNHAWVPFAPATRFDRATGARLPDDRGASGDIRAQAARLAYERRTWQGVLYVTGQPPSWFDEEQVRRNREADALEPSPTAR